MWGFKRRMLQSLRPGVGEGLASRREEGCLSGWVEGNETLRLHVMWSGRPAALVHRPCRPQEEFGFCSRCHRRVMWGHVPQTLR